MEALLVGVSVAATRIFDRRYAERPLGTRPGDSRFATRDGSFMVLYAGSDLETALLETIIRDRMTGRARRQVWWPELEERVYSVVYGELQLLDLRGNGCVVLGAPTDAVRARNHKAGRSLASSIHEDYPRVDGILFSSRLNGKDVIAVFDRALQNLTAADAMPLVDEQAVADTFDQYDIQILDS